VDDEDIRSSGLVQVNDVYAKVPLWSASGPIARRWMVPTCVWKLYTARMGASVGRLPQEVLLEEFYELLFRDRAGRTCTCVRRVAGCV
jgi:hypothetical protein